MDDVDGSSRSLSISILMLPVVLISIRFISFLTSTAAEVDGSLLMLSTFTSCSGEAAAAVQFTRPEEDEGNTEVSDLLVCVDVGVALLFLLRLKCG